MLSKREREYLLNPRAFNRNYVRKLRFTIKRKLSKLNEDLRLIAKTHPEMLQELVTSNLQAVTKFSNASKKMIKVEPRAGFEPATCGLQGRRSTN